MCKVLYLPVCMQFLCYLFGDIVTCVEGSMGDLRLLTFGLATASMEKDI